MSSFLEQVRAAARSLIRAPGFAVTATLTLALGIGLSTAVFTVAQALLLRRLPVLDQNRLVLLWGETRDGHDSRIPLALDDVREFARRSRALAELSFLAFRGAVPAPVQMDGRVYPVQLGMVSGNFFDVLGATATLGRTLRPEDDIPGAAPVVALSYQAWQRQFGGDSNVLGKSLAMVYTGRSYTIVGVMPQGLEFPRGTDVWVPLVAYGAAGGFLEVLSGELNVLGRLKSGATAAQARAELTTFFGRPDSPARHHDARGAVRGLPDEMLGDTKPAVILVSLAAALLLFITCVNVANLLLVRATGRIDELVVRSALGADRARTVSQLLTESALLALAGGLVGVAIGAAAVKVFVAFAPAGAPRIDEIGINGLTVVAAVVITALAMIVSGIGPALIASRVHGHEAMKSGSRQSGGRRVRSLAEILVVAQVALAVLTLSSAALVVRSLVKLQQVNLAFESNRLLVVTLAMSPDRLSDEQKQRAALDALVSSLQALHDVSAITPVAAVPFIGEGGGVDGRLALLQQSREESAANPIVNMEVAAPNYFSMLGVPLLRGRAFSVEDRDSSAAVVIVSSSVANHFWPGRDPIGMQLTDLPAKYTVVGVVPDTRYREVRVARPTVYFPLRQWPDVPSTLLIRTVGSPTAIAPELRRAVADAHLGMSVVSTATLDALLDAPRAQPRLNAIVFALFAVAAVLLAGIGLFAIIATMVRQRTHELGIRMALGATSVQIRTVVMLRGLSLALVGIVIGIAGALAVQRLISALLFEISPTDSPTFLGVAALMLGVAGAASILPARSGMRIDPTIALRIEG